MSKTVQIPEWPYPAWEADINGHKYIYPSGTEQTVPDEVAEMLDQMRAYPRLPVLPVDPPFGTREDAYTLAESTGAASYDALPADGFVSKAMIADAVKAYLTSLTGYAKTKEQTLQHGTAGGLKWVDNPEEGS